MSKMMKWSKSISRKSGWEQGKIFLMLHILQWVCLAFLGTAAILAVSYVTDLSGIYANDLYQNAALILFCTVGYIGFFVGCIGGVLRWYNMGIRKWEGLEIPLSYRRERNAEYGRISFPIRTKSF
ncbi:MAG: hypothetical protein LUF92_01455 [Clostridiales bacterium]|nr:hypothetical protein [Clostridiales bacterium]